MSSAEPELTSSRILRLWWPLAVSWLLMAADNQMLTAFVARMPDAMVHLAAWGSIVFPLSLLVEGPIIMLLAASTALCRDGESYRRLRRFMHAMGAGLTALHVAIAFTPLFDVVAVGILGAPEEVVEPGRLGLRLMTPWTWSIAHRRFHQGILIRHERSRAIGIGTGVRLAAITVVLALGKAAGGLPGIAVGGAAVASGVLCEAAFIARCVRPILRERVLPAVAEGPPLSRGAFLRFYVPLAITPSLTLAVQPVGAWAINHMPLALESQASWIPVYSFVFFARGVGFAFNEVVVALLGRPGAVRALKRFALALAATSSGALLATAATPLGSLWFGHVSGLDPELTALCRAALWIALPMPAYAVLQSLYQGALVHVGRTRAITEAVAIYAGLAATLLAIGAAWDGILGLDAALTALVAGGIAQTAWLALRSRSVLGS